MIDAIDSAVEKRLKLVLHNRLEARQISVEVHGQWPEKSLIFATHPTKLEGIIWRQQTHTYHAAAANEVGGGSELRNVIVKRMKHFIPVPISGEPKMRKRFYETIAETIMDGNNVVYNPTGKVSCSNTIPAPNEIAMGTYRVLQHLEEGIQVVPAVICYDGTIKPDGDVVNSGSFQIYFGSPYNFPSDYFHPDIAPQDFQQRIVNGWIETARANQLDDILPKLDK